MLYGELLICHPINDELQLIATAKIFSDESNDPQYQREPKIDFVDLSLWFSGPNSKADEVNLKVPEDILLAAFRSRLMDVLDKKWDRIKWESV